jgi:hypothetical protein
VIDEFDSGEGRPDETADSAGQDPTAAPVPRLDRQVFGGHGALSDAQLREAAVLLGHLNEAWFGYRSGDPLRPCSSEPRAAFDPALTTQSGRLEAKAAELGCSVWKLYKKRRLLEQRGLGALVDGRTAQSASGPAIDGRLRAPILAEAQELADASDVRKMQFRARVASRLARESGEPLELSGSRQTFNLEQDLFVLHYQPIIDVKDGSNGSL